MRSLNRFLISAALLAAPLSAFAEDKPAAAPAAAPAAKADAPTPAAKAAPAEPLAVRAGYLFGLQTGMQLRGAGLDADDLDSAAFVKGVKEGLGGGKPKLNNDEVQATFMELQAALSAKAAKAGEKNKTEGAAFLVKNKSAEGVKSTASGLQYKVLKEGAGNSPAATDNVTVHYKGTLLDGKTFDSSYDREKPATFAANRVIKGWTEALQLMKPGGKYQLWIPADLAYGDDSPPGIPPGSTLVFEVELIKIEAAAPAPAPAPAPK